MTVTDDDNTNQLIRDLSKKRTIIKCRLTRFSNYINSLNDHEILPNQTYIDLKLRIQGVTSLFAEFNVLQTKIEELVLDVDIDEQLEQRELFESIYYDTVARAQCMLASGEVSLSSKKAPSDFTSVKLPTISIPTFDGSYEHWLEFRDTFQSLIHESDHITSIQKFHYLKSSLKGSAALVIDSLEFSASNYDVAWELLLTRYDNSRLLVHNHVKSLFSIQALTKEAPDLLRNLIDTILKNLRALKLLGEPVDGWDTLIIYIAVTKLDRTTEREWEQYKSTTLNKSGDSKSILKVDVLLTFLKDRADMLETLQVSHASTCNIKQITNTQNNHKVHCNVTTNNPHSQVKSCLLCKDNHPLYACQRFLGSSLESRLKIVRENSLCENCLRAGHSVNECRFGPCRKCDQKHNSLIHQNNEVSRNVTPHTSGDTTKPVLAMHSSLTTALTKPSKYEHAIDTHTNNLCAKYPCIQPVMLPTAIVEVLDKQGNFHQARALLDSGSERCIITRSLCDKLDTKIIQSTHEVRGVVCELKEKPSFVRRTPRKRECTEYFIEYTMRDERCFASAVLANPHHKV
ncbi:Gag-pol polyprotein [Operophtera brumata]|uniref:Gag-pol polyprotein n=1 Tax=Operophtera brumata TaxID=104452 RepID=A0A0L7KRI4_OPEBR|nr:Gag-pol polyprotein [Operophtera brumata]KOB72276.1 Gag-pol polyprotein [Operophtera brumata]KOB74365.1 Gag-pol polyprotein [Operophtera brumata]